MRIFKNGNWIDGNECPFCSTKEEGEVVLIPINERMEEGNHTVEAKQIHTKCIRDRWVYSETYNAIICKG